jgi:iron complex outermembrane recepter protein
MQHAVFPTPFTRPSAALFSSFATALIAAQLGAPAAAQTAVPESNSSSDAATQLERVLVTAERENGLRRQLNEASSTASSLGLPVRELPVSVSTVNQADMQSQGLRSALEATVTAVGVSGGVLPGSIPRYSLRGFTDNNITLLRDGFKQNSVAQSSRPVDAFMLDRIEVLKGPSSMMHGEGAVGGAVNYVSRQPSFRRSVEGYFSAGQFGASRTGVAVTGPLGDSVAFQGALSLVDDTGYAARNRNQQQSASVGVLVKFTPRISSLLQFDTSDETLESWFGLPLIYDAVVDVRTGVRTVGVANIAFHRLENARLDARTRQFNYNLADSYTDGSNQFLRWQTDVELTDSVSVKNTAYLNTHYLNWRNSENYVWNPATQLVQRDLFHIFRDDKVAGNRLQIAFKGMALGRPLLANAGFDISHSDVLRGLRPAGALPGAVFNTALLNPNAGSVPAQFANYVASSEVDVSTKAAFAEAMFEVSSGVKLFAGLRHDRLSADRRDFITPATSAVSSYQPTTGRMGVNWAVSKQLNVYANYATSADPVSQLVSVFAAQKDLPLQKGRQLEVGSHYASADATFDLSAALFRIVKSDLLVTQVIGGVSVPQTVGQQAASGLEVAAAWRPFSAFNLDANAAYTQSRFNDFKEVAAGATFVRDGNTPPNVPTFTANLNSSLRIGMGWSLRGGLRYVGERFANNANLITLPAFTTLDLAAQWDGGPWSANLRLRNATDKLYADWAINQGLQQRVADPRSLDATLRYRF